jgi:hypothetical protein
MLKKIALTIAILALAANSFAAATVVTGPVLSSEAGYATAGIKFVPSKSVVLGFQSGVPAGSGSGSTPSVYSIASKNKAGDLTFATTSASTAIVKSAVLGAGSDIATTHIPTLPADANDSTLTGGAGGWSVL